MTGRDSGRGGRAGFDRDRPDRPRGNSRERPPMGGFRDRGPAPAPTRPWERRDDVRPPRPSGDRPFDRPNRDDDTRVEHYYDGAPRPQREERDGPPRPPSRPLPTDMDRSYRAPRDTMPAAGPGPAKIGGGDNSPKAPATFVPAMLATPEALLPLAGTSGAERLWSHQHLTDSWRDEERLRGWIPSDDDLREMVEDNIEADPQLNARDRRNIGIVAARGTVTLSGTVRSRKAKFAAGSDAFWTFGVQDVRNELVVKERGPHVAPAVDASPGGVVSAPVASPSVTLAVPTVAPSTSAKRGKSDFAGGAAAVGGDVPPAPTPKKAPRTRKAPSTAATALDAGAGTPAAATEPTDPDGGN